MAHQYSSTPPYGAQHPAALYYSPFALPSGQQMGNGTHALQQPTTHPANLQGPTPLSNSARYDANSNIHQQHMPIPFAPHLNPDFLKNFPPPPIPPPLPNPQFGPVPGTPVGYMHFPPVANAPNSQAVLQPFPPFPQSTTPLNGAAFSGQGYVPSPEPRFYNQIGPTHNAGILADRPGRHASPSNIADELIPNSSFTTKSSDGPTAEFGSGAGQSRAQGVATDFVDTVSQGRFHTSMPTAQALVASNGNADHSPLNGRHAHTRPTSVLELKERAKAALLSLTPLNIRYEDLLAEGVSAPVLQHLYHELQLDWRVSDTTSDGPVPEVTAVHASKLDDTRSQTVRPSPLQPSSAARSGPSSTRISPVSTPIAKASPVISSSMERKDRIAQLLAAKTGKASSGVTSKSQSPASVPGNKPQTTEAAVVEPSSVGPSLHSPHPIRSVAQTQLVKQKIEQLRKETLAKAQADQAQAASSNEVVAGRTQETSHESAMTQGLLALSTPVREQLAQSGFTSMIPGLFMTAADYSEGVPSLLQPGDQNTGIERMETTLLASGASVDQNHGNAPILTAHPAVPSRKRSVDEDSLEPLEQPEVKRQATQTNSVHDAAMDLDRSVDDSGSEGEIIEDEPANQHGQSSSSEKLNQHLPQTNPSQQRYVDKPLGVDAVSDGIAVTKQSQLPKHEQSDVLGQEASSNSSPTIAMQSHTATSLLPAKTSERLLSHSKADERAGHSSPRTLIKATPEQIAERAAHLKAEYLRQRALRQKQLQEGLPVLNDEVTKTQNKLKDTRLELAEIRREIQQYETNVARAREAEKELIQNMERLEKQITEGITGQKQFSTELDDLKQINKDEVGQPAPLTTTQTANHPQQPGSAKHDLLASSSQSPASSDTVHKPEKIQTSNSSAKQLSTAPETETLDPTDTDTQAVSPNVLSQSAIMTGEMETEPPSEEEEASGKEVHSSGSSASPPLEAANEVRDDDSDEAMVESDDESEDSRMSIDQESNDSISMSDSGSEEYEPAEPESSRVLQDRPGSEAYGSGSDDGHAEDGLAEQAANEFDVSEDYEPTEDTSPMDLSEVSTTSGVVQNPHQSLPAFDVQQPLAEPQAAFAAISQAHEHVSGPQPDDQENGLQLSEADTLTKAQTLVGDDEAERPHVLGASQPSLTRYVPYQSPLNSFKSYRFHPTFNDKVKNGYRSLTYSHKIDPKLPLCPTELNGIVCTDPQCQDQHFSSMALPDEKILVQMSSANHIKDKDLRDQYLIGLKQVIARLRQDGVKDFSAVADALSRYRRDWTAAQTRVN